MIKLLTLSLAALSLTVGQAPALKNADKANSTKSQIQFRSEGNTQKVFNFTNEVNEKIKFISKIAHDDTSTAVDAMNLWMNSENPYAFDSIFTGEELEELPEDIVRLCKNEFYKIIFIYEQAILSCDNVDILKGVLDRTVSIRPDFNNLFVLFEKTELSESDIGELYGLIRKVATKINEIAVDYFDLEDSTEFFENFVDAIKLNSDSYLGFIDTYITDLSTNKYVQLQRFGSYVAQLSVNADENSTFEDRIYDVKKSFTNYLDSDVYSPTISDASDIFVVGTSKYDHDAIDCLDIVDNADEIDILYENVYVSAFHLISTIDRLNSIACINSNYLATVFEKAIPLLYKLSDIADAAMYGYKKDALLSSFDLLESTLDFTNNIGDIEGVTFNSPNDAQSKKSYFKEILDGQETFNTEKTVVELPATGFHAYASLAFNQFSNGKKTALETLKALDNQISNIDYLFIGVIYITGSITSDGGDVFELDDLLETYFSYSEEIYDWEFDVIEAELSRIEVVCDTNRNTIDEIREKYGTDSNKYQKYLSDLSDVIDESSTINEILGTLLFDYEYLLDEDTDVNETRLRNIHDMNSENLSNALELSETIVNLYFADVYKERLDEIEDAIVNLQKQQKGSYRISTVVKEARALKEEVENIDSEYDGLASNVLDYSAVSEIKERIDADNEALDEILSKAKSRKTVVILITVLVPVLIIGAIVAAYFFLFRKKSAAKEKKNKSN